MGTVPCLPPHRPLPDTAPSLREEGVGERSPFPQSVACPTFCFEITRVIFDLFSCCPCSSLPSCFLTVVAGLFLP